MRKGLNGTITFAIATVILGAGGLGMAIGLLLWRKHKAQSESGDRSRNELPRMH